MYCPPEVSGHQKSKKLNMREYNLEVSGHEEGMRLDLFIAEFVKKSGLGLSRTSIKKLILAGKVRLKDAISDNPHLKVKEGDRIDVSVEDKETAALRPEDIPLAVIYEDRDLAVINKQPGMVVHPAPGNAEHTLVNALLARFEELSRVNPQRPGIVHRIDKDTSGVLVIAKNDFTHLALAKQFAKHSIKRKYVAVVKGRMEFDEGVIEVPIGRHPYKRKMMSVDFGKNAKYARTHYRTLKRSEDSSLLELELFTGRTHQVRVHLKFLGHPVLGDVKYGRADLFSRLALHAKSLGFIHPRTGKYLELNSDTPPEFLKPFKLPANKS